MTPEEKVNAIAYGTEKALKAEEVCTILDISRSSFDRWVNNGKFPRQDFRFGDSPRWLETTVKEYLIKQTEKKPINVEDYLMNKTTDAQAQEPSGFITDEETKKALQKIFKDWPEQQTAVHTDINTSIMGHLNRIEREHNVKILYAVESGSRGWGFASPDSDYDVRFIYAPSLKTCLSIMDTRDVIDVTRCELRPEDIGVLDVTGWSIQKAAGLALRNNASVGEWLNIPIVYSAVPGFREAFLKELMINFNPVSYYQHYISLVKSSMAQFQESGSVKKLLYGLRCALAANAVVTNATKHRRVLPPVTLRDLIWYHLYSDEVNAYFAHEVKEILKLKAASDEHVPLSLDKYPMVEHYITNTLTYRGQNGQIVADNSKQTFGYTPETQGFDDLVAKHVLRM